MPAMRPCSPLLLLLAAGLGAGAMAADPAETPRGRFIENYCADCHDADTKKGDLNLDALGWKLDDPANFDEWAKIYRRVTRGEMRPKKKTQPPADEAGAC